jgi:hypothetical protein
VRVCPELPHLSSIRAHPSRARSLARVARVPQLLALCSAPPPFARGKEAPVVAGPEPRAATLLVRASPARRIHAAPVAPPVPAPPAWTARTVALPAPTPVCAVGAHTRRRHARASPIPALAPARLRCALLCAAAAHSAPPARAPTAHTCSCCRPRTPCCPAQAPAASTPALAEPRALRPSPASPAPAYTGSRRQSCFALPRRSASAGAARLSRAWLRPKPPRRPAPRQRAPPAARLRLPRLRRLGSGRPALAPAVARAPLCACCASAPGPLTAGAACSRAGPSHQREGGRKGAPPVEKRKETPGKG